MPYGPLDRLTQWGAFPAALHFRRRIAHVWRWGSLFLASMLFVGSVSAQSADQAGTVTLDPASLTDPDGGVTGTTWQWAKGSSSTGTVTDISGATNASYTPAESDENSYLRATASYTDSHGSGKTAAGVSDSAVTAVDTGCEASDIYCATLTAGAGTLPTGVGYVHLGYGALDKTTFTYNSQSYEVQYLYQTTTPELSLIHI